MKMTRIYRQKGFILNPDDKVVNGIFKALERSKGLCPCYHTNEDEEAILEKDLQCPCKEYRENKHCRCNLYIKEVNSSIDISKYEQRITELEEALANAKQPVINQKPQEVLVY